MPKLFTIKLVPRFLILLLLFVFFLPYFLGTCWKFIPATMAILTLSHLIWKQEALAKLGLKMKPADTFIALLLTFTFFAIGKFMIPWLAVQSGAELHPSPVWIWRISPFFQAFNEELVLRALLLGSLNRVFKSPMRVSITAALFFSLLHWILYRYSIEGVVFLQPLTLLNLTLFGFICNHLYFHFNHVGYGVALHAGWNLTRFSGCLTKDGNPLLEGATFNLIEGSLPMTGLLITLLVLLRWARS